MWFSSTSYYKKKKSEREEDGEREKIKHDMMKEKKITPTETKSRRKQETRKRSTWSILLIYIILGISSRTSLKVV